MLNNNKSLVKLNSLADLNIGFDKKIKEARRQVEICNACRYCESYCAVFPAITRKRSFSNGDIVQLSNLCHNCRGCYYACQYAPPHEFGVNFPRALAEVRHESWKKLAWPKIKSFNFKEFFDRSGTIITIILTISLGFIFFLSQLLKPESGEGFYAYMSHGLMVSIFLPSFLLPLLAIFFSIRSYWKTTSQGGGSLRVSDIWNALISAAKLKNLDGGHGDGCNYEDEDRFTMLRRWMHHAVFYGFMLCFASTTSGAILHYIFDIKAPYGLLSVPKLFGIPGGTLLCIGTAGLAWLKLKADKELGVPSIWGGEMAFILLLFSVSFTGMILFPAPYFPATASWVSFLLPIHLGTVLAFFLLTPYSKMVHGFYRMIALVKDASIIREDKERKK